MSKVIELKQQEEKLITDMRSAVDLIKDNKPTAEQRAELDGYDSGLSNLRSLIKANEEIESAEARQAEKLKKHEEVLTKEVTNEQERAIASKAFEGFVRGWGLEKLNAEERSVYNQAMERAQAKGTDSAGGYLTPEHWSSDVIERMVSFGGMLENSYIMQTSDGNTTNLPTSDDTSNVATIIAENAAASDTNITFGEKTIGSFEYTTGFFKVPRMLLRDSVVDIPALIAKNSATRFGRGLNAHFTNGTGSGQPEGLITGLVAASGTTTSAGTAAVTVDEIINLIYSLDSAYRKNAKFMMNDTTLGYIRKLKDGQGNYLWQMGDVAKGVPSTFQGYQIAENYSMDTLGVSNVPIVFGDINEAYTIRRVGSIVLKRAEELFLANNQVGFISYGAFDGKLVNPNAIKGIKNAAS
jgi:HK97 family phage major capsid protein